MERKMVFLAEGMSRVCSELSWKKLLDLTIWILDELGQSEKDLDEIAGAGGFHKDVWQEMKIIERYTDGWKLK